MTTRLPSLFWFGEQQGSKSAVLNSAVSGGLNVGVAKCLITLDQISLKTQLRRFFIDVLNSVHKSGFTMNECLTFHV